mgnify:CR=1 FL=1
MHIVEHPIESPHGRIFGKLALPDGATGTPGTSDAPGAPLPLVIYSHGFDSSGERGLRFAEAVTHAGLALYCFDFRGGSTSSRSVGSPLDMSVLTEVADLTEVVDVLTADPRVDAENVFLFGASFGGLVSALVAACMPERIRGLALHYPGFCIPDDLHARFASAKDVPETFFCLSMDVGRRYATDALALDPYAAITAYTRDVLITHGSEDSLVNLSYSRRAAAAYAHAELHVIEGAGHGFADGPELDQATGHLVRFLASHVAHV